VVDDEGSVRVLLVFLLTRAGYEVCAFETAEACLADLAERPAQLVIADRVLPGMDGIELFRRARAIRPGLEGILVTGFPSGDTQHEASVAGMRDYVIKPFQVSDILAVCQAAMKLAPKSK